MEPARTGGRVIEVIVFDFRFCLSDFVFLNGGSKQKVRLIFVDKRAICEVIE